MDDIKNILNLILEFRKERDWEKFHTPKNLATSIAIESTELLELFQWARDEKEIEEIIISKRGDIEDEIADILCYILYLAHDLDIDINQAIKNKVEKNIKKYPVEKAKGISLKYNEL